MAELIASVSAKTTSMSFSLKTLSQIKSDFLNQVIIPDNVRKN